VELWVRAKPRATRPGIGSVRESTLEVRLASPPVEGAANQELITLLADALAVPRSSVVLVRGERGRQKRVQILGITVREARARLWPSGR
jgi:uncharacterized protein (TIGR00251 family)